MVLSYSLQSVILSFSFSLCVVAFIKILFSHTKNKKLPPSPPALPFIGHLHLIKAPIHQCLARISQKYGPMTFLRFGSRPVLVISSKSLAQQCFTTHDLAFANRPQMPTAKHSTFNFTLFALANYGPYWRSVRRITAVQLLSSPCLRLSSNVRTREVQDMARRLFRSWRSCELDSNGLKKLELKTSLFQLILNVLMTMIAGKRFYGDDVDDSDDVKRLREGVEQIFALTDVSSIEDFIPILRVLDLRGVIRKSARLAEQNKEMAKQLIEEHRTNNTSAEKENTMIAHLLKMQKQEPEGYKDETIQAICMTLLLAGTDTTSNTLEWAMAHLVNNPDVLKKAATEIDDIVGKERLVEESDVPNLPYLNCILSEVLRLSPAAPFLIPHESREDVTIGGYNIPRGAMLFVNAYCIQRDPDTWDEPSEFKPERFEKGKATDKGMLTFGMGRRGCPGEGLAMQLMGQLIGVLIQCFSWQRPGVQLVDMTEAASAGATLAMAVPLEVVYRPRESMLKLLSAL